MKGVLLVLFTFFSTIGFAQTYRYLGPEDGLSSRKVYSIQKDKKGFMWFLTSDGVDRYDGKYIKHYKLMTDKKEVSSFANMNRLHADNNGGIWEVSKNGKVFRHNNETDKYELAFQITPAVAQNAINTSFIDSKNRIWLFTDAGQYIYDINTLKVTPISRESKEPIMHITQQDSNTYFMGTKKYICVEKLVGKSLKTFKINDLDTLSAQVTELFYHGKSQLLFIGCFMKGLYVYDCQAKRFIHRGKELIDVSINSIKELNSKEILIATDGAGVYKMDLKTGTLSAYIVANYREENQMNGNIITDLYVDNQEHIWMANYPIGITIRNNRFPKFQWIKHYPGNSNSLINKQINSIMEDSDGDIWYATSNGISLYNRKTKEWNSFLSTFDSDAINKNHIFITLCEVTPGVIWAGGYTAGMYIINKKSRSVEYLTAAKMGAVNSTRDKYIRIIYKDREKYVWVGGFNNLRKWNLNTRQMQEYPGINVVTAITEKNADEVWIGTGNGLFLVNKKTGNHELIPITKEQLFINSLHQEGDSMLFIGTSNLGMITYHLKKRTKQIHDMSNSALISNNIYTIIPDLRGELVLSTENSLVRYNIHKGTFQNWTKEQGLISDHFNATSGVRTKDGMFLMGSSDGVIAFSNEMRLPTKYPSKLIFSDFSLFYQQVQAKQSNSNLRMDINDVKELELRHNENIFSLRLISINYDYPSNVLYSWKLEGFYNTWNKPSSENLVRYTNLDPGQYTLRVRAISQETQEVLEERSMIITINPPFWGTIWAYLIYTLLLLLLVGFIFRIQLIKKDRKTSAEKINFFINTAHDIRTPLTLIKAPLDDLKEKETLSESGRETLMMAIRSTNMLFSMITNLINFEKADHSSKMHVSEHELYSFLDDVFNAFKPYTMTRNIQFTYESNFRFLNVWFDESKMASILKNLVSNALKYTPEGGSVHLFASSNPDEWSIEISDTGIGIPTEDQKNLFKIFFRGSNAINTKIVGSGIGLPLVKKLVRLHKGTITLKSKEKEGTSFKITFPHGNKHYRKDQLEHSDEVRSEILILPDFRPRTSVTPPIINASGKRLLVVEDNSELRLYLRMSLSEKYSIFFANNGQEALEMIKSVEPDLIISDIMMPVMRGDELCETLKSNFETSHIPIILLSALSEREHIIRGLKHHADDYIGKPFDIGILKATIENLLANRILLQARFSKLELKKEKEEEDGSSYTSELDLHFMTKVKEAIEKNLDNSNFTVDTLCAALHMSRTSFYNKIKALTGQAPADFVRYIRLEKAAKLLLERKYSITEVADKTGFSDAKYFREVFKKHFDMSPTKYIEKANK